jgi:hypothetical protein
MPIEYDIDPTAGILVQTLKGKLTASDFLGFFTAIKADARFREDLRRLVITTDATAYPPPEDVTVILEPFRRRMATYRPFFAVVASTPLGVGMANMFMGQSGLTDRMQVFGTRADAEAWLRSRVAKGS